MIPQGRRVAAQKRLDHFFNADGGSTTAAAAAAAETMATTIQTTPPIRFEDMALEDLDEEAIARMLEEADKEEVSEVDATGVKQLLLLLERKINRNQMMRVKFPDQPARFVDSEVGVCAQIWVQVVQCHKLNCSSPLLLLLLLLRVLLLLLCMMATFLTVLCHRFGRGFGR